MSLVRYQTFVRAEPAGWLAGWPRAFCSQMPSSTTWPPSAGRRGARLHAQEMSQRPSVQRLKRESEGGRKVLTFWCRPGSSRLHACCQHTDMQPSPAEKDSAVPLVATFFFRTSKSLRSKFASSVLLKFALDLIPFLCLHCFMITTQIVPIRFFSSIVPLSPSVKIFVKKNHFTVNPPSLSSLFVCFSL